MKFKLITVIAILIVFLFTGCASNGTSAQMMKNDIQKIAAASKSDSELFLVTVPAADNMISEKMVLSAMSTGIMTTTAQNIKNMLSSGKVKQLGIVGKSQTINIATIKQAINALDKKVDAMIYIVAKESESNAIKTLASQKGLNLVVLPQTENNASLAISQLQTEQQNTSIYEDNELTKLRKQVNKDHFNSLKSM